MSFFLHMSLFVWYTCVYACQHVYGHMECACVWSLEVEIRSLLQMLSPLQQGLHWTESLPAPATLPIQVAPGIPCILLLHPGITGRPLHPTMYLHVCWGGGLNPRPCISESSALITELSFQPLLPSFNLICQIIPKAYSHRVMPNHLTIIVSLQNCDSESRMHSNPWLCDTPSTPVWTELRFLYVCPGSLIYPKISSCRYLWEGHWDYEKIPS